MTMSPPLRVAVVACAVHLLHGFSGLERHVYRDRWRWLPAFGDAGRAIVEREFAWPAAAARLLDVYEEVARGARFTLARVTATASGLSGWQRYGAEGRLRSSPA